MLAYEGPEDPTRAGVAKSRGVKTVVVVDRDDTKAETETETTSAASRWGEDPEDTRRYTSRDGWRHGDEDDGEPSPVAGTTSVAGTTPLANARRTAASALNRATPDTVPAVARAIRDALSTDPTNASAEALGVTLARRAAREPSYRETYADLATREEVPPAATTAAANARGERLDARARRDGRGDARGTRRVLRRAREAGYGGGDVSRGSRRASPRRRRDRRGGR